MPGGARPGVPCVQGSHHLCPREARTGRRPISVQAKTWSPVWRLGPQRQWPLSPSLRQKPRLPAMGLGGGPEVLSTPPSVNQCFPKPGHVGCAYEMTLCGLGWAFFILTVVCLFLWLPSIYGHEAGFLLTEDGEFLPGQTGTLVGGIAVEAVSHRGACLWSIYCAPGPANRLSQAAGGWWARG